ncbi:hypothetical protein DM02DRAFT_624212 [Periconia macrospinosa]|uniref:Uncharacterized protein n=1 Tax=Periconia macrospinosa TaxID=97972 RepID=A0A2V1E7A8_9PLEO|nr:hypothetical protein DM02DRAFT_624212 [Periconia macrospinosa]
MADGVLWYPPRRSWRCRNCGRRNNFQHERCFCGELQSKNRLASDIAKAPPSVSSKRQQKNDLSKEPNEANIDSTRNTISGSWLKSPTSSGKKSRSPSIFERANTAGLNESFETSISAQNANEEFSYENVYVLMVSWEGAADEPETRQQHLKVEQLEHLFAHTFKYNVEHRKIDTLTDPSAQLKDSMDRFLGHGGPNNLLIFYYKGHFSYNEVAKECVLHRNADGLEYDVAAWEEVESRLTDDTYDDTLVILDCDLPSNFQTNTLLSVKNQPTRALEILLPGEIPRFESTSLTTFVFCALIYLSPKEEGAPNFSTVDIVRYPKYRDKSPKHLIRGSQDRNIYLGIPETNTEPKRKHRYTVKEISERLAGILWEDAALVNMAIQALSKSDGDTFCKHHDYILKRIVERAPAKQVLDYHSLRKHSMSLACNFVGLVVEPVAYEAENDATDFLIQSELSARDLAKHFTNDAQKTFRIYLFCFTYPEKSVKELMNSVHFWIIEDLLENQFNEFAKGELAWIQELQEAGHTTEEIACLLREEAEFSPWILFEPRSILELNLELLDIAESGHAANCVHEILGRTPDSNQSSNTGSLISLNLNEDLIENIQEATGLAGVVPIVRNKSEWDGTVDFDKEITAANICYSNTIYHDDMEVSLERARICTHRFLHAFSLLQSASLCCNTFTVITHQNQLMPLGEDINTVEMHHIDIKICLEFAHCLEKIAESDLDDNINFRDIQECVTRVLSVFGEHEFTNPKTWMLKEAIHMIALAAQFFSLGFLLYNQAHMGHIHPFFLDQPLTRVYLWGLNPDHNRPYITVEPVELTCVGDMLQSSVMAFSIEDLPEATEGRKFDLVTTAENLLDTWGPGNLIVSADDPTSPQGMQLCGGLIYCVEPQTHVYHWSKDATMDAIKPVSLDLKSYIRIGAIVSENPQCSIDVSESWSHSQVAFEYLGTQDSCWVHDESQVGAQAGQYVLLQYNRTRHKKPGKTLKQLILEYDERMIIYVLDNLWGLQVSFCTGVARRVPLRLLIADLLPVFATNLPDSRYPWEKLNLKHKILDSLQNCDFQKHFSALPEDVMSYLRRVIRRILMTLQPTGVDSEGKYLMVAWPYGCPPYGCFKIPCHDKQSSWVRVLADSTDCATFAYITTSCLETHTVKCRGPKPLWHNTSPVLETAIIRHNEKPSEPLGPLEHKKLYFFKKMDDMLQVTVERTQNGGSNEENGDDEEKGFEDQREKGAQ